MGDVLPPKRTVVERLRLRLERYRWHHNSCLPRYEQSASALCDKQRQDTIRLKQRFLESKAKKAKSSKSDHHRTPVAARDNAPDAQKQVTHSKPTKATVEGSPANPTTETPAEDIERSAKPLQSENVSSEPIPTVDKSHPSTPSFSLPVVPQFPSCNPSTNAPSGCSTSESSLQQAVPNSQSQSRAVKPPQNVVLQNQKQTSQVEPNSGVKCKQEEEKPPEICQFKSPPPSSDRLSDTFPSIGFAEDSGDNVIHPDLLKDLIDDVFTNSDLMKDFDFEDSVCSMKDVEKDDIDELVKASTPVSQMQTFHQNSVMFSSHSLPQSHSSGSSLFDNSVVTTSAATLATVTTTSVAPLALYGSHQRLSYSGTNNNFDMPNGLGLDFKLTEPSPAALTLKQMAEQHQNMQQKQQHQLTTNLNSFGLRNNFGMDSFPENVPNFSNRFLNRPFQRSQNSSMFQSIPYDPSFPGVVPLSDSNMFKQESFSVGGAGQVVNTESQKHHHMQIASDKKSQSCVTDRPGFYQENVMQSNPNRATTQYVGNITPDVPMSIDQAQQISVVNNAAPLRGVPRDIKQTDASQQSYPNMYTYNTQHGNEHMFHLPMNQHSSYNPSYNIQSSNHCQPPPDYKISQSNIRPNSMILNQTQLQPSPSYQRHPQIVNHQTHSNVASNQWGAVPQVSHPTEMYQQQASYGNLNCAGAVSSAVHQSPMHPYRTIGNVQMSSNRVPAPVVSSNRSALQQQQQQVNLHQQHSGLPNININLGVVPATQLYNSHQDLNARQDSNQISLDFLDHIESSAPDLLNFDNVIQNSDTTHFQLLDEMEMLSK